MPVARPEPSETRVIAHVDLDCFYVQVEQRKRPELRGKPTGVVQYNPWKGGGLIAVGYEARRFGVTRNMRGDEAKKVCPGIELVQVPTAHGKADLTQYRDAGSEVVSVLSRKGTCERASIDEVYLDITEASAALSLHEPFSEEVLNSHILGYSEGAKEQNSIVRQWLLRSEADPKDHMLATGAVVIAELRMAVLEETGFTCSAGVAHNKMLAKLASGMHKPAQQTLVPSSSVSKLLATLPIKKMKQLGGKLGDSLQADLHISFVGDLLQFSELKLQDLYGVNTGTWLWNVARGMSGDEVKARTLPKSHSCGKTFPGPKALKSLEDVEHWMTELAAELQERLDVDLEQNHRMAHLLTVHAGTNHGYKVNQDRKFPSKSCVLRYGKEKIAQDAVRLFERGLNDYLTPYNVSPQKKGGTSFSAWAITSLFIGASNMWATPAGMNPITRFFLSPTSPSTSSLQGVGPISPLASPSKSFSLDEPLQGVGPISPLASPSKSFSLDEPLSPREKPSSDDETMVKACKIKYDFDTKGVGMCSESNSSMHPAKVEQSEQLMENLATARLLYDSSCIPQKGIGDAHGRGGDKQTSDARLGNHGKMPMDASDSVGESEVICTPTFGNFGHVNAMQCMLQLPASGSGISDVDLECSNSNPLRMDPIESSSQAPHLVIHCSPVEQEAVATYEVKDTVGSENSSLLQRMKAPQLSEIINTVGSENPSLLQRTKEPQRSCTAVGSRQQPSGFLKLKDVWDRKGSSASQCIRSESSVETTAWGYKQGEIDEAVLSELPEEIQEELYRSFGFKRQRMVKRSTIGDFFKGSSAHGSNKSNI